jgi:hypothetical protein
MMPIRESCAHNDQSGASGFLLPVYYEQLEEVWFALSPNLFWPQQVSKQQLPLPVLPESAQVVRQLNISNFYFNEKPK